MNRFYSIRVILPVIIALFMVMSISVSFYVSRHLVFEEIVEQESAGLHDRLNFLQGVIEHFLKFDEIESIRKLVSSLSSEPDLLYLAVASKDGVIVASSVYSDWGTKWKDSRLTLDRNTIANVLRNQVPEVVRDDDSNSITGYSSLCVRAFQERLKVDECGFIIYKLDLNYQYSKSEATLYRGFLLVGGVLSIGIIALLFILNKLISKRVEVLVNSLSAYAEGDHTVRSHLSGQDELSWLSTAVNDLLDEIRESQADTIEREQRLENLFQTVLDAIIIIDNKGIVQRVNKAAEKLFGYAAGELVGRNVNVLMPEPYHAEHDQYISNYKKTGIKKVIGMKREVTAVKRNGEPFAADISITEMKVSGRTMFSGIVRDITERKEFERVMQEVNDKLLETNQKLNEYATKDGLTNIHNRRSFDQRILEELNRATRDKLPLSLLMCDIDYFKLYNDTYGHQAGDDCLYKVATVIKTFFQRGGEMVARYGGEEFVVVLPNTDLEGAKWLSAMLLKAIHELAIPHSASKAADKITMSIGIGSYEPSGNIPPPAAEIIRSADEGLYMAKANGRDRIEAGKPVG